jgi:hypothetical protein
VPIAGRAAVTAQTVAGSIVTVTALTPQVRSGDVLDLCDASMNVLASVTTTSGGGAFFTFSGSAIVSGAAYVVGHGHATDWQWFDISPKGDFVLAFFNTTLAMVPDSHGNPIPTYSTDVSAIESNVQPKNGKAIICICPPGSPELSNPAWAGGNVYFWTGYPAGAPGNTWRAIIAQGMSDRFWVDPDDTQHQVDGACVSSHLSPPLVEARLTAPPGAPMQFTAASPHRWVAMPQPDYFGMGCSGVWNYGYTVQPYTKPFGFLNPVSIPGAGTNPANLTNDNVSPGAGDGLGAGDISAGGML